MEERFRLTLNDICYRRGLQLPHWFSNPSHSSHLWGSTKGCLVRALCTASAPATQEGFSAPYGGYLQYVTVSGKHAKEERIE
jgi:hypothetical protein